MPEKGPSEDEIKKEINQFIDKYKSRKSDYGIKSEEFTEFRQELIPIEFTLYEKACNFCDSLFKISLPKEKEEKIKDSLESCNLNTTANGVTVFAIFFPMVFILAGSLLSLILTVLFMKGQGTMFFIMMFIGFGLAMIIPLTTLPNVLANSWRLKASNQMVLSIFYIVSYMRHTSNFELAIKFTSDHITPPLSLDFKKIIWNVETSKYSSIKESIDHYLEKWKPYNMEFVESMHLIEASLYETSEKKRLASLEKSMSLILEATFENMLHFAQDLKSPITMLHMLGVILPILGLVILPLAVSFMEGIKWYHIAVIYNIFLPVVVWYLGKVILSTRPTGYGQADITDINPELKKHTLMNFTIMGKKTYNLDPKWVAFLIIIMVSSIGFSPLLIQAFTHSMDSEGNHRIFDIIVDKKFNALVIHATEKQKDAKFSFLGYKVVKGELVGPYGLGATLISIAVPLGLSLGLGFYYKTKTKKLVQIRQKTKDLEAEFASALFQLGNRIGDGLPAEIAFAKVAENVENTPSGKFFDLVANNIAALGMGVEDAIFDKKHGAINKYPSALIESSMKVFVESSKKGPDVASEALINISTYIKEMHKVDERLKDLMSEISSSMKSQINFLAPVIAGVVIGLTSMITTILNVLSVAVTSVSEGTSAPGGAGGMSGLLTIFGESIPTFYFQLVVGLYIVQITYLLTTMLNTMENGYDPLNEKYMLGQYITKSTVMYSVIATIVIMIFNMIAITVVSGIATG